MLESLVPLRSIDLAEHREFIGPFLEFCSKRAVRHCPARPAVVATYLADCAYRGEDFALKTIDAIEALHEHHGLSNPIATRLVTVALDKIVTVEPPRWPKEDKILFARLPTPIKLRIAERETQRDTVPLHQPLHSRRKRMRFCVRSPARFHRLADVALLWSMRAALSAQPQAHC